MTRVFALLVLLMVAGCSDTPPPAAAAESSRIPTDPYQKALERLRITPPASPWANGQKQLFATLLGKHQVDVLIAPVQVHGGAFDRVERKLIDARLAHFLAESTGRSVADPVLVARALGEGRRVLIDDEVSLLAASMHAAAVVWPYAGHDGHGQMAFTVRLQKRQGTGWSAAGEKQWAIGFSDEKLPSDVLGAVLPEIAVLVEAGAKPPALTSAPRVETIALPASPQAMITSSEGQSQVVRAYYLQLLALLSPDQPELGQERAFVRALTAVDGLASNSPDVRLLKARALFHLDRRPAALRALTMPETPAERALLAALNGNLPDMEREVALIESPVHRLLAEIELADMRAQYDALERAQFVRDVVSRVGPSEDWGVLLKWRYMQMDSWEQDSNIALKALLDRSFPIEGFTAESIARSQAVLAQTAQDPGRFELSVQEHFSRLLTERPGDWCCQAASDLNTWDLLNLVEAQAEANLLRQIQFYRDIQARPDLALRVSDRFDPVYHGHGALAAERAKVLVAVGKSQQGAQAAAVFAQAFTTARDAMYWSDPRTSAFANALWVNNAYVGLGPGNASYQTTTLLGALRADFPRRWWQYLHDEAPAPMGRQTAERALRYATTYFGILKAVVELQSDPQTAERILQDNEQRFVGSPDRLDFLAHRAHEKGNVDQVAALYEEARARRPNDWNAYRELAGLKIEQGEYAAALQRYLEYPPFAHPSGENRVAVKPGLRSTN